MPIDSVLNDVRILCQERFELGNRSEHDVRYELKRLVENLRRNYNRCKKQKTKVDKNPSRTKNTLITPCGIRKREEENFIQRSQRRRKIERLTAPSYVPDNPNTINEGSSTIDDMHVMCLHHRGHNLNDYHWDVYQQRKVAASA